jgi:hypothetical protein
MKLPDHELWQASIDAEITALTDIETWKAVKRPEVGQVLKSMWVFTKKKSDGSIARYKVRAVACGNEKVYEWHYDEVFSAVVDMTDIKLLLAIARPRGMSTRYTRMHQMHASKTSLAITTTST